MSSKMKHNERARVAPLGFIEDPSVSVTTDLLMKCSPSLRANGSDQEKWHRTEGAEPSTKQPPTKPKLEYEVSLADELLGALW